MDGFTKSKRNSTARFSPKSADAVWGSYFALGQPGSDTAMTSVSGSFDPIVLAQALQVDRLVPDAYAAWRPLLLDGLQFFFARLSPARLAQIFAQQLRLPPATHPALRLVTVFRQCPTLHKLGQVMARDPRLAPEVRLNLQWLESLEPTTPMAELSVLIQRELGTVAHLEIAATALAEASVAVVVPVLWHSGAGVVPQSGVLKVLRPGVGEQLGEELEIWSVLGAFLEERCSKRGLPRLDYRHTLDSVGHLLANEIRLDQEQVHLARAAAFYADSPAVLIPALWPFCTTRITAMQRVYGRKITESGAPAATRQRLATTLSAALLAKPFWNNDPAAIFHADPHAGNLLATDDGRLAILDWALVTVLSKAQRIAVVQAVASALTQNESALLAALNMLGRVTDPEAMRFMVEDSLRQVRLGQFPGMEWLMGLLDRLGMAGLMQFPEELTLFRKALLTLTGVIGDLTEQPAMDTALVWAGLVQCLRELPSRGLVPFDSRSFGSHLSNADWLGLWAGLPTTLSRYWAGVWQEAWTARDLRQDGPLDSGGNSG